MRPIARPEGHLIVGVAPDSRPPPAEFAEFFGNLLHVAHQSKQVSADRIAVFAAMYKAAGDAQVFDFGEIPEPKLIEEAKLGGKLMGEKLLRLPYESVLYWYTLTHLVNHDDGNEGVTKIVRNTADDARVRYATLAMMVEDQYFISDFLLLDPITADMIRRQFSEEGVGTVKQELARGRHVFLCSGVGRLVSVENGKWGGHLFDRPGDDEEPRRDNAVLGSLADGVAAMSMILATKGIHTRHEPAPVRLNAKRERLGKPSYPSITHVDTREYFDAVQRSALGGTHASPVPHLRRGHVRQYTDGRKTWVRSCMVNCRSLGEAQTRDHYEVAV